MVPTRDARRAGQRRRWPDLQSVHRVQNAVLKRSAVHAPSAMRRHAGRRQGIAVRQPGKRPCASVRPRLSGSVSPGRRAPRRWRPSTVRVCRSRNGARRRCAAAPPAMSAPPAAGRTGASSVVALLQSGSGARSATGSVCCRDAAESAAHRRSGSAARRPLPARVADWPAPGAARRDRSSASRLPGTARSR